MSEKVAHAEAQLMLVVAAMREAAQAAVEDALPCSMLDADPSRDAPAMDMPDTLRQRLEWETAVERPRVAQHGAVVQQRLQALRQAIDVLGGGVLADGTVVDLPVADLDREIEMLSGESARLGTVMVQRYEAVETLMATLEAEVRAAQMPSL
ncbi:hypothetical protein STCU_00431 [Strigomonas culicis]|uniref:Uncharacterized protein n=1 Tax=Strigomonas culicis TaxID=28005 RepID=S9V6N9_9TRYP|nr:hypothetical protein STCU_00431 [Strigomonas culicis]|eukprot:EPY36739.1 hypothetical protein STCU_00431 [Strigomonas culicis]